MENTDKVREHAQATFELTEALIAWAIEHRHTLEKDAADGCARSVQAIAAMDNFFETGIAMNEERDPTDVEFDAIVARMEGE